MKCSLSLLLIISCYLVSAQTKESLYLPERIVNPLEYKDTINQFWDSKWQKCNPANAAYFTEAYRNESGFWHCYDFYVAQNSVMREGFYADKSLSMPEGEFVRYSRDGKMIIKGSFVAGNLDGWFIRFDELTGLPMDSVFYRSNIPLGVGIKRDGFGRIACRTDIDSSGKGTEIQYNKGVLSSKGQYSEGFKKDSVWTYYYENGAVSYIETYQKGTLIESRCFDTVGNLMTQCEPYKMPEFRKGGKPGLMKYLKNNISFPRGYTFSQPGGTATIIAEFTVDASGKPVNIKIVQPFHEAFDKEVVDAIKRMPRWEPGKDHNRIANVYYLLPVTFKVP